MTRASPKQEPEVAAADRRARLRDHLRGSGGQEPYKLVDPAIFLIGDDWREVFAECAHAPPPDETLHAIAGADLVLAYFSKVDALASVEVGWAAARGKPVSIGFSDDLAAYRELRLVRLLAARIYFGSPAIVWREFEDDWIMTR